MKDETRKSLELAERRSHRSKRTPRKYQKKRQNAGAKIGKCSACKHTFERTDKLRVARLCHVCAEERRASNYGLSANELAALYVKQESCCAGCGIHENDLAPYGGDPEHAKLVIDHDHETGQVRGLLCSGCNYALGCIGDSAKTLRRLAKYIDEASGYRR